MKKFYIFITVFIIIILIAVIIFLVIIKKSSNYFIKNVPVISVPVARDDLESMVRIDVDDIDYIKIPIDEYKKEYIKSVDEIIGKYTNKNVCIKKGDYFARKDIVDEDELPGKWIEQIDFANGEEAYYLSLKPNDIFDNNILEDSYIDIYVLFEKDEKKYISKVLDNIKVLAVHDASGRSVYRCSDVGAPSYVGFGLSHSDYILLKKSEYLQMQIKILPVNVTLNINGENIISKKDFKNIINDMTLSDDEHVEAKDSN